MWELAGVVGVLPDALTLAELYAMAVGRKKELWLHTAHLLAMAHNANCASRDDCVGPDHFMPAFCRPAAAEEPPMPRVRLATLKGMFT